MTNRPLLLLLGTGAALGCNFPLGKLVAAQGINPALWAAVISGGAGLIMLLVSRLAEGPSTAAPVLRFSLVSGFISYVVPNFLTFAAIPHLGSGLVAVMFALSPVVTALLSIVLKVRPPSMLGLAGIGVGLVGAIAIIVARNSGLDAGQSAWLLLAALVPVSLGLGNVYRTLAWPRGAGPIGWRRSPTWRRRAPCWPWPGRWMASTSPRCSPCRDWSACSCWRPRSCFSCSSGCSRRAGPPI